MLVSSQLDCELLDTRIWAVSVPHGHAVHNEEMVRW